MNQQLLTRTIDVLNDLMYFKNKPPCYFSYEQGKAARQEPNYFDGVEELIQQLNVVKNDNQKTNTVFADI